MLAARIGQRVAFADAAQSGRLVAELDDDQPGGARDRRARRRSRGVSRHERPRSKARVRVPPRRSRRLGAGAGTDRRRATAEDFSARLTIDVTPALRGRIKVAAFRRGMTVADMLRALLDREFPDDGGAAS